MHIPVEKNVLEHESLSDGGGGVSQGFPERGERWGPQAENDGNAAIEAPFLFVAVVIQRHPPAIGNFGLEQGIRQPLCVKILLHRIYPLP
jgi:hypothetical protein